MITVTVGLQVAALLVSAIGAVLLTISQRPAADKVHGNIVMLRNAAAWRFGFVLLIVGPICQLAVVTISTLRVPVLKARAFQLYDHEGRLRAEFDVNRPAIGGSLRYYDESGEQRTLLHEHGLSFSGPDGRIYGTLDLSAEHFVMSLWSGPSADAKAQKAKAQLRMSVDGNLFLIYDTAGNTMVWHAP